MHSSQDASDIVADRAVVGASGSGKSTLFSLLTALYTPSGGVVRFDGHPVSDLDPTYLRGQIGVVAQEPTIFGGTIGDNIVRSKPATAVTAAVA